MVVPIKFRKTPEYVTTYDYFDIAEGTGIKNFYAGQSFASGAATQYFMTSDATVYSNKIAEKAEDATSTFAKYSDINYDIKFNLPKRIKGKARCSFSQGVNNASGTSMVQVRTYLYHYDGTTETLMASGATLILLRTSAGQESITNNIQYDLTTQTNFKAGDILRLNVELWGMGGAAGSAMGYGVDPVDRDDISDASGAIVIASANTTQLKLQVPFVLNL